MHLAALLVGLIACVAIIILGARFILRPRPRSGLGTARALHQAGLPGAGAASWGRRAGSAITSIVSPGFRRGLDVVLYSATLYP